MEILINEAVCDRGAERRLEFQRGRARGLTTHGIDPDEDRPRMGVNVRRTKRNVRDRARVLQGGR